jgi:Uma2 family endonuclease
MPSNQTRAQIEAIYRQAAQDYLRGLPLEHFMEATAQATQREITLESLALVRARRPEVQVFNELLVQYPRRGMRKLGQVVPDNMVVVHPEPIVADGSYDTSIQPVGPFLVLEYVSKNNRRKDYDDNMEKYERELKVPYYLRFYPDEQELTVFRHNKRKYVSVKPNGNDRLAIPELELEVALLDGWVRYWFRDELLPLPAELQRELDATRRELAEAREQRDQERQARLAAEEELARLRAELARRPRRNGS